MNPPERNHGNRVGERVSESADKRLSLTRRQTDQIYVIGLKQVF